MIPREGDGGASGHFSRRSDGRIRRSAVDVATNADRVDVGLRACQVRRAESHSTHDGTIAVESANDALRSRVLISCARVDASVGGLEALLTILVGKPACRRVNSGYEARSRLRTGDSLAIELHGLDLRDVSVVCDMLWSRPHEAMSRHERESSRENEWEGGNE